MKYLRILALFSVLIPNVLSAQMAQYEYQLEKETVKLKFMINRTDLLQFQFNECDLESNTAECAALYIQNHSSLAINGMDLDFEFLSTRMEGGRLVLYMQAPGMLNLDEVRIENNCFHELNPAFKNLVILNLGPIQGSYVMTIDNPSIELNQ